jgi:hypothetical protein
MNVKIIVKDVDDAPVNGAILKRRSQQGDVTDTIPGNELQFSMTDFSGDIDLRLSHPSFNEEVVRVTKSGQRWSNPTCVVSLQSGVLAITVILSRIQTAPTVYIPEEQLKNYAANPTGVLLADRQSAFSYRSLFNGPIDEFRRLAHPIFDDPNGEDWERFFYEKVNVNPAKRGSFRWLEYGESRQKFVIGLWVPKRYFAYSDTRSLDFVVFYSPSTAINEYHLDQGQVYPYGLKTTTEQGKIVVGQPYITQLGQNYLFNWQYLVYQLLAAKKKAIMVMPINNYGDWRPFQTRSGVLRLLKEIAHYAHKQHLLGPLVSIAENFPSDVVSTAFEPTPSLGRLAIAGFSSGMGPILSLFNADNQQKKLPPLFYSSNASAFEQLWKEIWDIDLAVHRNGGFDSFEKTLLAWLNQSSKRQMRMYHSLYTADKWRPSNAPQLSKLKVVTRGGRPAKSNPAIDAEEVHSKDGTWSAVYFSNEYLNASGKGLGIPSFLNNTPHQFIPKIALGHAGLMSQFEVLQDI